MALKLNSLSLYDGFAGLVIEGEQRIGKTSYISQALAEASGTWEKQYVKRLKKEAWVCTETNYAPVKKYMRFKPEDYLDMILEIDDKILCAIWDDAGYWLFSLDWYDPFVKCVSKFMQVTGTIIGCIALTTPNKKLISSKVMDSLPSHLNTRVVRTQRDTAYSRPRRARTYKAWDYPDGKKGGVRKQFQDYYNAMLPDSFFAWYQPIRMKYVDLAKQMMKLQLKNLLKKMNPDEQLEFEEQGYQVTGGDDKINEVMEVLTQLEGVQKAGQDPAREVYGAR